MGDDARTARGGSRRAREGWFNVIFVGITIFACFTCDSSVCSMKSSMIVHFF